MKSWKDNISFILVEPKEAGSIGASARALKNMGFKNLELVKPVHFFTDETRFMACNAVDLIDQAIVHSDLKDAIKDKSLVWNNKEAWKAKRSHHSVEGKHKKNNTDSQKEQSCNIVWKRRQRVTQ